MIPSWLLGGIKSALQFDSCFTLNEDEYNVTFVGTDEVDLLVFYATDTLGDLVAVAEIGPHAWPEETVYVIDFILGTVLDALEESISTGGRTIAVYTNIEQY